MIAKDGPGAFNKVLRFVRKQVADGMRVYTGKAASESPDMIEFTPWGSNETDFTDGQQWFWQEFPGYMSANGGQGHKGFREVFVTANVTLALTGNILLIRKDQLEVALYHHHTFRSIVDALRHFEKDRKVKNWIEPIALEVATCSMLGSA